MMNRIYGGKKFSEKKFYRVAALDLDRKNTNLDVKVIFARLIFTSGGGRLFNGEKAYFMSSSTYRKIPLNVLATVSDYRKFGRVVKAKNTDLYDPEK